MIIRADPLKKPTHCLKSSVKLPGNGIEVSGKIPTIHARKDEIVVAHTAAAVRDLIDYDVANGGVEADGFIQRQIIFQQLLQTIVVGRILPYMLLILISHHINDAVDADGFDLIDPINHNLKLRRSTAGLAGFNWRMEMIADRTRIISDHLSNDIREAAAILILILIDILSYNVFVCHSYLVRSYPELLWGIGSISMIY